MHGVVVNNRLRVQGMAVLEHYVVGRAARLEWQLSSDQGRPSSCAEGPRQSYAATIAQPPLQTYTVLDLPIDTYSHYPRCLSSVPTTLCIHQHTRRPHRPPRHTIEPGVGVGVGQQPWYTTTRLLFNVFTCADMASP